MTETKPPRLIGSQRDAAATAVSRSSVSVVVTDSERSKTDLASGAPPAADSKPQYGKLQDGKTQDAAIDAAPIPEPSRDKVPIPRRRGKMADDLEAEFSAIFSTTSMDSMMSGVDEIASRAPIEPDTKIVGTIIRVTPDEVFLALGGRDEGVLARRTLPDPLPSEIPLEVGKTLEVTVLRYAADDGLYEVSTPLASAEVRDWSHVREGLVVDCLVTKVNTGGLECQISSLRGFIPISQIALFRVEKADDYLGQRLTCVITEANSERGNLILSRRAMLEREREEMREKTKASLEVGQVLDGTVRKIIDAGAFVDLGGVDGFIPIGSLTWGRVRHPGDVLSEGQQVKVRVSKIDWEANRISLVYRDDAADPWLGVASDFVEKAIVRGRVSRVADFGAFVEIVPGVEGLVHISELANKRVTRVSDVVREGDEVEAMILTIEPSSRRMSLSIKAVQLAVLAAASVDTISAEDSAVPEQLVKKAPQRNVPLQGGTSTSSQGGERFGLKW